MLVRYLCSLASLRPVTAPTEQPVPATPDEARQLRRWAIDRLPRQVALSLSDGAVNTERDDTSPGYTLSSPVPIDGRMWICPDAFLSGDGSLTLGTVVVDEDERSATPEDEQRIEDALEAAWSMRPDLLAALLLAEVCDSLSVMLTSSREDVAALVWHMRDDARAHLCMLAAYDLPSSRLRDAAVRLAEGWSGSPTELVRTAGDITT